MKITSRNKGVIMDSIVSVSIGTDAYRYYQCSKKFSRKEVHELFKYMSYITEFDGTSNYTVKSVTYCQELKAFRVKCYADNVVSAITSLEGYFALFNLIMKSKAVNLVTAELGDNAMKILDSFKHGAQGNHDGTCTVPDYQEYLVIWISADNWGDVLPIHKFVDDRNHNRVKKMFAKPGTSGKAKKLINIVTKVLEGFDNNRL